MVLVLGVLGMYEVVMVVKKTVFGGFCSGISGKGCPSCLAQKTMFG